MSPVVWNDTTSVRRLPRRVDGAWSADVVLTAIFASTSFQAWLGLSQASLSASTFTERLTWSVNTYLHVFESRDVGFATRVDGPSNAARQRQQEQTPRQTFAFKDEHASLEHSLSASADRNICDMSSLGGWYATPDCSPKKQQPTPETPYHSHAALLEAFDWSILSTRPSKPSKKVKTNKRNLRPQAKIIVSCRTALCRLKNAHERFTSFSKFLEGIEAVIKHTWTHLIVYFDRDETFPNARKLWANVLWRKWDVVDFFTAIAKKWYKVCRRPACKEGNICTETLEKEFLSLVECIVKLGEEAKGAVICIKDWERIGTKEIMEAEIVEVVDIEDRVMHGDTCSACSRKCSTST